MAGDAKGEYRGLAYRDDAGLKAWLAKRPTEEALEPELPIIDPHHHFWDTPARGRYLLPELLADIAGAGPDKGHNIVSTVFLECRSMYRKDGPPEMAPVGEVEFVNGIAAMSASGGYGPCRVAETGSVLLSDADLHVNAVAYLAQHLIVLLDPADIVVNLHQAYRRPEFRDRHYASFHTGPSATADIEGVLIHGAQGVRSLSVLPLARDAGNPIH